MNICNLTEAQVEAKLLQGCKDFGVTAPRVIVMSRMAKENSITRLVRFAVVVPINNESLIDSLIADALKSQSNYHFMGSEVNLQNESMEVDYLFFEAKIMAKQI